jgi:hypothetical protein
MPIWAWLILLLIVWCALSVIVGVLLGHLLYRIAHSPHERRF